MTLISGISTGVNLLALENTKKKVSRKTGAIQIQVCVWGIGSPPDALHVRAYPLEIMKDYSYDSTLYEDICIGY